MEYRNLHLKIGIDSRISIAPEIEANNQNGLVIDFYSQRKKLSKINGKNKIDMIFSEICDIIDQLKS